MFGRFTLTWASGAGTLSTAETVATAAIMAVPPSFVGQGVRRVARAYVARRARPPAVPLRRGDQGRRRAPVGSPATGRHTGVSGHVGRRPQGSLTAHHRRIAASSPHLHRRRRHDEPYRQSSTASPPTPATRGRLWRTSRGSRRTRRAAPGTRAASSRSTGHAGPVVVAGHPDPRLTGAEPVGQRKTLSLLLYSDDVDTRAAVRLAIGKRLASDLPAVEWTECATQPRGDLRGRRRRLRRARPRRRGGAGRRPGAVQAAQGRDLPLPAGPRPHRPPAGRLARDLVARGRRGAAPARPAARSPRPSRGWPGAGWRRMSEVAAPTAAMSAAPGAGPTSGRSSSPRSSPARTSTARRPPGRWTR